ncbi:hypothetical protein BRARA_A03307 [Brassica rapa]|uniref:ABC-type xenobiotic transporter n=1 Tax=Brassica campestris TaxID=3711 RepID=A0A398AYR2_BRACM|nr:hypothetical protein BRARA_A03307 [Brassica rapa]
MENPLDFLLIQPIYLPLLSFFLNLVLLLILFVSWVYNKKVACENSDDFMAKRSTNMSSTFSKLVVMCCVSLSVFYSVLLLLSCVRWHSNVWTLFDLLLAALTWGAISMYLRGLYTDSHEQKLPYLLRVWWVLYVLLSCYRLVVDFVLYKKQELVSVHIVVSDLVGVCAGLLLCCSCLWKQGEGERNNLLEEPLLIENEVCDDEVTTPFSKAGFLSLVSFSWMSPLVTLGNEKIIDSKDVPQVDSSDRAENLFRVFRSKLEWDDGERRITTFKLVKALFLSVWRDILLSFLFAFVSTMSCYVAPYLMDTFGACVLLKIPLESGKILAALAIFQLLQSPIYKLPETISMFVQVKVSLARIASFLCLDDLRNDVVERLTYSEMALEVRNGSFSWDDSSSIPTLRDVNFMELVGAHTDALATVVTYEQGCDSSESTTNKEKEAPRDEEKLEKDSGKPRGGQLVQQEEREKGKVGFTVYKKYMALAYGGAVIPIILLVQILFQVLDIGSNYWMTWVTPVSKDVEPWVSGFTLILVYVLLAIASSLCILVRTLLVSMTGFKMATELFTQMHLRVFRASMSFFDVTPMGRILNRASTDQSVVDLRLPGQFAYVAIAAINILGIMGVMIQVAWQVLIIFIPVVAASSWYRQYYISAARELARLAGISRSPLVHHFSETLSGVTTIRSFDQEPRFLSDIMKLSDCLSRLAFHSTGATEWLCFRLELLATIAFALSLVIVVSAPDGTVNPSFAGLAITYALNLNNLQSNLVWTLCELENKMISVERMLQYIDIPSEPSLVIESTRPEKSFYIK